MGDIALRYRLYVNPSGTRLDHVSPDLCAVQAVLKHGVDAAYERINHPERVMLIESSDSFLSALFMLALEVSSCVRSRFNVEEEHGLSVLETRLVRSLQPYSVKNLAEIGDSCFMHIICLVTVDDQALAIPYAHFIGYAVTTIGVFS